MSMVVLGISEIVGRDISEKVDLAIDRTILTEADIAVSFSGLSL